VSAGQAKQPVAVVAESLMRTCYDEANRLANHGSNGLERMVMSHLYDAANEAKARLAAAAADVADAPTAAKTAFASSAWVGSAPGGGPSQKRYGKQLTATRKRQTESAPTHWTALRMS
jgi:hypothetical protein